MPKRRKEGWKRRKINGKRFTWKGWGYSQKRAKEIAKNLRKLGNHVRVIPTKKTKHHTVVWDIFARKKKK